MKKKKKISVCVKPIRMYAVSETESKQQFDRINSEIKFNFFLSQYLFMRLNRI